MKPGNLKSESIKRELKQFFVLVRHFLIRLFNNDIIKYENQKRESLIILLTLLAVAGGAVSVFLLMPYISGVMGYTFDTVWSEKTFFLTLSMAFTGIISIINWDNIFLDEKDYLYLSSLPIKTNVLFGAKFFSLLVFIGIISLALNIVSIFVFTLFLGKIVNLNPFYDTGVFQFGFIHLFTTFMANLFIFLVVALIQSVLMILFNTKRFKKISIVVQTVLLLGFISVFAWFPRLASSIGGLKESYSSFVYYFPPLWFVGFYEQMIGNYDFVFKKLYYIAGIAVVLLCDLYLISIAAGFKKYSRTAVVSETAKTATRVGAYFKKVFHSLFLQNPIQKAIFYFSLSTLNRSRKHKLQLVIYIALPLAVVITEFTVLGLSKGWGYFENPAFFLAAAPLVLYFFLVIGLRMVVMHPITPEANWIFRLTCRERRKHYLRGLRKAFFFIGMGPLFLLLFIFYFVCWGFLPALYFSLFVFSAALLVLEITFADYWKMPFVSGYVPGKLNIRDYWIFYAGAFLAYVFGFTTLGLFLMRRPLFFIAYYALFFGLIFLLRSYRHKQEKDFSIVFEEEPEPAMMSLGFDL